MAKAEGANGFPASLGLIDKGRDLTDDFCGNSGRGLQRGMGNGVGDRCVDLVANPGEDGNRSLRDTSGQCFVVKDGQVTARPAAADYDDHIEIELIQRAKRRHQTGGGKIALDPAVAGGYLEADTACLLYTSPSPRDS